MNTSFDVIRRRAIATNADANNGSFVQFSAANPTFTVILDIAKRALCLLIIFQTNSNLIEDDIV